ncbi:MAG: apolipoprotein N-acyltransferase [Gemmataceae bacterium]|nr:apolipoprotein N-acyltransferase [Gemmataceae bacterium]
MTLFLSALASSGLLYLCYFPAGMGWLAWFALVPWLALAREPGRPRRLYLLCWLASLPFAFAVSQWLRVADWRMYFVWLAGALWVSAHFPLSLLLVRALDRRTRLPLALTLPLAWVSMEFMRGTFPGGLWTMLTGDQTHDLPRGFGWYFLGHTQQDHAEVIQVADLGGAYLVSALVASVNGLLFEVWLSRAGERRYRPFALLVQALAVCAVLGSALAYGVWQLGRRTSEPGPRVALLQGNIDQRSRNEAWFAEDNARREEAFWKQWRQYTDLGDLAMKHAPDLVVWPETSEPRGWAELERGKPEQKSVDMVRQLTLRWPTAHLLGMNTTVREADLKTLTDYNSALLALPGKGVVARYDKVHRVLFGEYIPGRASFFKWLMPYDTDYGIESGTGFPPLRLKEWTFGAMICYEATDPSIARAYARQGADFLVNISNEGWFDGTSEHEEGLAITRFRAVETRRAVVRAVNMGISAVIDANGRVVECAQPVASLSAWTDAGTGRSLPVNEWGRFKKSALVVVAQVPLDTRGSLYAWWGDTFALSSWAVLVLLLALGRNPR